jgi:hypothetical protein
MNFILNNKMFQQHQILKLFLLLIVFNIIYNIFSFFFFFLLKSVFPIFYIGGMLKAMNNLTTDKPISQLIKKLKHSGDEDKEESLEDTIQATIKKNLGKLSKSNFTNIPEIKIA